jgi:hypothetical protein
MVRRVFRLAVLVTIASLCLQAAAWAEGRRVRWRGLAIEGRAPAQLGGAAAQHVAVALRQLGLQMVSASPAAAEVSASCVFVPAAKVARCLVEVQSSAGGRGQRRAEIPFHDAEDLAESLALMVSDTVNSDFPDMRASPPSAPALTVSPSVPAVTSGMPATAWSASSSSGTAPRASSSPSRSASQAMDPPESDAELQRRLQRERAHQRELEIKAEREEKQARAARPPSPSAPGQLVLEGGPSAVFGFTPASAVLGGGTLRLFYAAGNLLRAGGTLSLTGGDETEAAQPLSFFRMLVAARAGVGVRRGIVDLDLTGGPALLVLAIDAHSAGRHSVASLDFIVGARLGLSLVRGWSLVLGVDVDAALTEERVVSGGAELVDFSRPSLEVTVGIGYRR